MDAMAAAVPSAAEPSAARIAWTPSDAVLLHPARFAPLPEPPPMVPLAAEWEVHGMAIGWGLGLLGGGSAWLIWPPVSSDGSASWPFGVAALVGGAGFLEYWRRRRRGVDARALMAERGKSWLLGQSVRANVGLWLDQVLIASLLAREAAGQLQLALVIEDGAEVVRVRARASAARAWPADSLEDRLIPMGADDLASMVHDWLAGDSHDPHGRAVRLVQHGLVSRGLGDYDHYDETAHRHGGLSVGDTYVLSPEAEAQRDAAPVEEAQALLARCKAERPALWTAMRHAIVRGLVSRDLPPVYVQRGPNITVPTYPHVEPPLHLLDAPRPVPDDPDGDMEVDGDDEGAGEDRDHCGQEADRSQADPPTTCAGARGEARHGATADPPVEAVVRPPPGPAVDPSTASSVDPSVAPLPGASGARQRWAGPALALLAAVLAVAWPPRELHAFIGSPAWDAALLMALGTAAFEGWQVFRARRRVAARRARDVAGTVLPPTAAQVNQARLAAKSWAAVAQLGLIHGTLALVLARWVDGLLSLMGLAVLVAVQVLTWRSRLSVSPEEAVRAVMARLAALQRTRTPVLVDDAVRTPTAAAQAPLAGGRAPLPVDLTDGDELPDPDPALVALLRRAPQRRQALFRVHWWATGILVAGALLLLGALAAVGDAGWVAPLAGEAVSAAVVAFSFLGAGPVMLAWQFGWLAFKPEGAPVPGLPRWVAQVGRVVLLTWALHLPTVPAALLAGWVLLQWLGLQVALTVVARRHPLPVPARLTLLRVFGAARFEDFSQLIAPWRSVGLIEYLEGQDTVGQREDIQAALADDRLDDLLATTEEAVRERLAASSVAPDSDLRFGSLSFQCANDVWQTAVQGMLDRSDAVVMDLTALSPANAGCAWELGQLLDRVPLSRVTLLINDNTDLDCLQGILAACAARISASSPNLADPQARWRLMRIGGYAQRQPGEAYFQWRRRLSRRLDATLLSAHLLASAQPLRSQLPVPPSPKAWQGAWHRVSPLGVAVVVLLALGFDRLA